MRSNTLDIIVIGGGTAGLVTASGCARLGRKVALVEREALGGDCLWTGCVPTKALIATARLAHQAAHGDRYGLSPHRFAISPRIVMESMRETQRVTQKHDDPEKFRKLGIDVIFGQASLENDHSVRVGDRLLRAKDIVLATGSRTRVPDIPGLQETGFLDHVSFLHRDDFPRTVTILGGGYIGVEFAQMLARFGSKVTLVHRRDRILPREDDDVSDAIETLLRSEGVTIIKPAEAARVARVASGKRTTLLSPEGIESAIDCDEIFVATGRRGNIEELDLERAGVRTERSFVVADRYLETTAGRMWACGDIHGKLLFTHVASHEAVQLVRNILFPGRSAIDYSNVPWCIYTDPEVGHIGLTEREARERQGDGVRTFRIEMADLDRAVVDRTPTGFLKLVCDRRGRILGGHALCTNASTLIAQVALARQKGMKAGELARIVTPYPSMADAVPKIGSQWYQALTSGTIGRLARKIASLSQ